MVLDFDFLNPYLSVNNTLQTTEQHVLLLQYNFELTQHYTGSISIATSMCSTAWKFSSVLHRSILDSVLII